jgi:hypothetical protein
VVHEWRFPSPRGAIAIHEVTPLAARAGPLAVRRSAGMRSSRNVSGTAVSDREPPIRDFFQKPKAILD